MTKKHFIALADALRSVQPASDDHGGSLLTQWEIDRDAIASNSKSPWPCCLIPQPRAYPPPGDGRAIGGYYGKKITEGLYCRAPRRA